MNLIQKSIHYHTVKTIELLSFIFVGLDGISPKGKLNLKEDLTDFEFIEVNKN